MATNPYLQGMADDIGRRSNNALQQGLQGIRSNSVMNGGFGGSRQGVAEGAAISGAADSLQGNLANMYNTDYQAGENRSVQREGFASQAASARYSADQSLAGSKYGADSNYKGQELNYKLGLARNEIDGRNADTNALNVKNQFDLGKSRNENDALGTRNNYDLGLGRNAIDSQNSNTNAKNSIYNYEIGTNRNNIDKATSEGNLGLGRDKLTLDTVESGRRYDLGLRGSDLASDTLDANIYNSNFNNQLKGIEVGNDAQDRLDKGNGRGVAAGTAVQNTPIDYYKTFTNTANAVGNGYGTDSSSASSSGNPYVSAIGGAQLGQKFAQNLGMGSAPVVMDGGYGVGQGSAYGGNRRGM